MTLRLRLGRSPREPPTPQRTSMSPERSPSSSMWRRQVLPRGLISAIPTVPYMDWKKRVRSLPAAGGGHGLQPVMSDGCLQCLGRPRSSQESSLSSYQYAEKRPLKEWDELEKRRKEQDELEESDFVAWSFVIYPDEGPSGDFFARATFVRRAPMFTARDWGTILLYVAIFFVTMFAVALIIGPVGAVVWGLFLFAALTRCHIWGWAHNFVYYLLLFIVVCIAWIWYSYVPHRSWAPWIWTAVFFGSIASLIFYFRAWVTLPRVQLPQRTMPVVHNFGERDLYDFFKLKRRFGLLKNVFVGHHYVEGIASVLIPSVIFNSFAVRKALLITCDFILPLSFILAASHHGVGMAKALRNLVNEDWLVRFFRYIHQVFPWEVVSWDLFGFRWMVDEVGMHLQNFVWRIVIPFDAFLTTARARYNQFLGAIRPIGIMLKHVHVYSTAMLNLGLQFFVWIKVLIGCALQSLHPVKVFLSIVFGVFHAIYYVIAVPVKLVFLVVQAIVTFIVLPLRILFGPLLDMLRPLFSGMGRRLALVATSVHMVVQGPLAWWKNQLLFCTPKSGRSLSWWKYVTNSIGAIWAIICGYCRALVGAEPIEEDDVLCDGLVSAQDALDGNSRGQRQRKRPPRRYSAPASRTLRDDESTPSSPRRIEGEQKMRQRLSSDDDDGSYRRRARLLNATVPMQRLSGNEKEALVYRMRRPWHSTKPAGDGVLLAAEGDSAVRREATAVPSVDEDDWWRIERKRRADAAGWKHDEDISHKVSMEVADASLRRQGAQESTWRIQTEAAATSSIGLRTVAAGTLFSADRPSGTDFSGDNMNTYKRRSASEAGLCVHCGVRGVGPGGGRDSVSHPTLIKPMRELDVGPSLDNQKRVSSGGLRRAHGVHSREDGGGKNASAKSSSLGNDRCSGVGKEGDVMGKEGNGEVVTSPTIICSGQTQYIGDGTHNGMTSPQRRGRTLRNENASSNNNKVARDGDERIEDEVNKVHALPKKRGGKTENGRVSCTTLEDTQIERAAHDENTSPKKRGRKEHHTYALTTLEDDKWAEGGIFDTRTSRVVQRWVTCSSDFLMGGSSADIPEAPAHEVQGKGAEDSRAVRDEGGVERPPARAHEGLGAGEEQPPVRAHEGLEDVEERPTVRTHEVLEDGAKGSAVDGPSQRKRGVRKRR